MEFNNYVTLLQSEHLCIQCKTHTLVWILLQFYCLIKFYHFLDFLNKSAVIWQSTCSWAYLDNKLWSSVTWYIEREIELNKYHAQWTTGTKVQNPRPACTYSMWATRDSWCGWYIMSDMAFVLLYDMHLSNWVGPESGTDPTLTLQLSNLTITTLY